MRRRGGGTGATLQTISNSKSTLATFIWDAVLVQSLMLNWEGLCLCTNLMCACRRLEWTGRPPLRAALRPRSRSTLRAQQHLGVNHGELSEYTHTPRLSHGRGPSGASAWKLGDGLHWERRGLLYRVRANYYLHDAFSYSGPEKFLDNAHIKKTHECLCYITNVKPSHNFIVYVILNCNYIGII